MVDQLNNTAMIGFDHGCPDDDKSCEITYSLLQDGSIKVANWRAIEPKPALGKKRAG